jgi:DNA-binding IclR family transcriptional regulator
MYDLQPSMSTKPLPKPRLAVPAGRAAAQRDPRRKATRPRDANPPQSHDASVRSVAVAFGLVEQLAAAPDPLGVSEVARRLGLTKARVHRHLATLRSLGYAQQERETDRYTVGPKLFTLGTTLAEKFALPRIARQHLERLHGQVGQTVVLAMPAGNEIAIVDAIQSREDVAITVRPGSLIPLATSALGRVIAAFRETPGADGGIDVERLKLIRKRWYELAVNERIPGVSAVAAPIFDENGRIAGSVGIVATPVVLSQRLDPRLRDRLQEAAAAVSSELKSRRWQCAPPVAPSAPRRRDRGRIEAAPPTIQEEPR